MFLNEKTTFDNYPSLGRFSRYLEEDEKCKVCFNSEQKELILSAFDFTSRIHAGESRSESGEPYITHPIALVLNEIHEVHSPNYMSIIVLLLHDTIETNPDCFSGILTTFGIDVFSRVLKLSKISAIMRPKIQDSIFKYLATQSESVSKRYMFLLSMLGTDARRKKSIFNSMEQHEEGDFKALVSSYEKYLLDNCEDLSTEKMDMEVDGLWHYVFFDKVDARHKFRDTIHNLMDVPNMQPSRKIKYLTRRMPKLQALIYVLRRHGMKNKIDDLIKVWMSLGGNIDQYGQLTIEFPKIEGVIDKVKLRMHRTT